MSGLHELGIDAGNVANGHTTLWTADRGESASEEVVDNGGSKSDAASDAASEGQLVKRSYYGDVDLGPAQRSQFYSSSFAALAAFVIDSGIAGTEHRDEITSLQLNTPAMYMTAQELRNYETIEPRAYNPPGQNAKQLLAEEVYSRGLTLHTPSGAELFPLLENFAATNEGGTPQGISGTLDRSIPVTITQCMEQETAQLHHEKDQTLPVRHTKQSKAGKEPWSDEQKQAHCDAMKLRRKRLAAPIPDLFQQLTEIEHFQQRDDTAVKLIIHEDPRHRSYIRIRNTFKYKDDSRPKEQPQHKTDVNLTYRNTGLKKKVTHEEEDDTKEGGEYRPSERIIDVSDKASIPTLAALFPHLTRENTKYWDRLYATLHWGHQLTHASFTEPMNPTVDHKGIKPTNELPKFVTLPEYVFETWNELADHCGVGGIIEQRFGMQNRVHRGLASAHPVPHTQTRDNLDMVLYLNFSEEDASPEVPKLTAGDPVRVEFDNYKDNTASKHAWHGRVAAPAPTTAIGQICIERYKPGPATVFKDNGDKECKRLALALERMRVFGKMRKEYVRKEHFMKQIRTMLLCHDHNQYDKTSLFDGVHPDDRAAFMDILPQLLKVYQHNVVTKWLDQGVLANTVVLGGMSGSGKPWTSMVVLVCYTLRCLVDPEVNRMQLLEMSIILKDPSLAPPSVAVDDEDDNAWNNTLAWDVPAATNDVDQFDQRAFDFGGPTANPNIDPDLAGELMSNNEDPGHDRGSADDEHRFTTEEKGKKPAIDQLTATSASITGPPSTTATEVPRPVEQYQNGLVTHCCIQNETVDHSFDSFVQIMTAVSEKMNLPMKLIIPCHSVQSELNAVIAMMDPHFEPDTSKDPRVVRRNKLLHGDMNALLLEHCLRQYRSQRPGITDRRFRALHGSVAWTVLQLARFPGVECPILSRTLGPDMNATISPTAFALSSMRPEISTLMPK
ncbi:hypothetical protein J1614_012259 [Plenodomus biglobosus]|nr:hypothetical protein J1614_012259 [Plenodomus biglobosus]